MGKKRGLKVSAIMMLVIALAAVPMLAGCKKGSQSGSAKNQVTIKFSYWGDKNELKIKKALIEKFEKTHPNIKIDGTYTDGGTYPTKLQTFFSSNTAPDVISVANDIIYSYIDKGVFEDLTPYIDKDGLMDQWKDGSTDTFLRNGKILAAPFVSKVYAMAYNKKLFDQAGVTYPKAGWTEEAYCDMAKKLTTGKGTKKIYGSRLAGATDIVKNLYGVEPMYDVDKKSMQATDNDSFKHAMTLLTSLSKEGYIPSTKEVESIGGGFETGRFATSICATWDMDGFEKVIGDTFDWDVVDLPVNSEYGQWHFPAHNDGIAMSSKSKKKDAAWEFIKWNCANEDAQKEVSKLGVPVLKSYSQSNEYLSDYPDYYKVKYNKGVFNNMFDKAVRVEIMDVWAKINDEMRKQFSAIELSKESVDEGIKTIQKKGEEALKG